MLYEKFITRLANPSKKCLCRNKCGNTKNLRPFWDLIPWGMMARKCIVVQRWIQNRPSLHCVVYPISDLVLGVSLTVVLRLQKGQNQIELTNQCNFMTLLLLTGHRTPATYVQQCLSLSHGWNSHKCLVLIRISYCVTVVCHCRDGPRKKWWLH